MFFDAEYEFVSEDEEFPFDNYPLEFPRVPVRVDDCGYDPTDLRDAVAFAGVFGIDELAPADYQKALAWQREYAVRNPAASDAEVVASFCDPLVQECPSWHCLNPECRLFKSRTSILPFCVVSNDPVKGFYLFEEFGDVQVIFEVCCECGLILASNQAT
ncbi:hypothetical protein [Maioricimonas rarisocia]|uniref:hypothetical protein n=1 Tax=Maioricimonas rarisocia TaxID=2528026 RepID=UPI0011A5DF90|nr:hypothetical protein [Maioricimonas rarisocia]